MARRRVAQPDTEADVAIRERITLRRRSSFVVVAGAGSGKTTSLVKALASVRKIHGKALALRRQRIACITYTEIAAREIWGDVGSDPQIHVSTIHSFFWSLVRTFQRDICEWVLRKISQAQSELVMAAANFGPRVQQRTREKNLADQNRMAELRERCVNNRSYAYGTGSNFEEGVLGHDDVIQLVSSLLIEKPLFRKLLAQQFPFLFVDESQDTMPVVVSALKAVEKECADYFCLGFFGDPMQKIYLTGVGAVALEDGWIEIAKPENFRSSPAVLAVANAIRRAGDGLVQHRGSRRDLVETSAELKGVAKLVVLPQDERRAQNLDLARDWFARETGDERWRSGRAGDIKMLVIVHRMAAQRLGFADIYAALNDSAPEGIKSGFLDGTTWLLRPFLTFVLPLCEAIEQQDEFEVMNLLREYCPSVAELENKKNGVSEVLKRVRGQCGDLAEMLQESRMCSVADVLSFLCRTRLIDIDRRFLEYLADRPALGDSAAKARASADEDEQRAVERFLSCTAFQLLGYRRYVEQESPFSTQQGIKGAEFDRVLVLMDDSEGTHKQFSYDKYFGVVSESKTDIRNAEEGKETIVDRTRRLFYVCCTRARNDLLAVYFAPDVELARKCVLDRGVFPQGDVLTLQQLH